MVQYDIKTASNEELPLFFSGDKDEETGCIGHLRCDFGNEGKEFWHTWFGHCGDFKTQDFKDELDMLIGDLRKKGNMLQDLSSLVKYCYKHSEARIESEGFYTYGFLINTTAHSYYIRAAILQGGYNVYCYCYNRSRLREYLSAI